MSLLLLLPRLQIDAPATSDAVGAADVVTRGAVLSRRAFFEPQAPVQRFGAADLTLSFPHVVTRSMVGARAIAQGVTMADAAVRLITGGGTGFWAPAFMSRPSSGALNLNGNAAVAAVAASGAGTVGDPYLITNKSFDTLGTNVIAITFQNVTAHTTVLACDFRNVAEGIYAVNSNNINVGWCRYKNITGPHAREGFNRANFVQFNNVSGGRIYNNKGREGDTEDIVSIFASDNIIVEDNAFEGTNWTSPAGSGIALGDIGGFSCIARRNTLINPGQVGIFIAGGTNNTITENIIFKNQVKAGSGDVGIYVWKQPPSSPTVCSGHTVSNNRIFWRHFNGSQNNYWSPGNCGTVTGIIPQTNTYADATIDPVALSVVL